mgnify:CR=1 FL=1
MSSDLHTLDFDAVRRILRRLTSTPYGSEAAEALAPASDLAAAERMQAAVSAARRLLERGDLASIEPIVDIRGALRQAAGPGAILTSQAFFNISAVLRAVGVLRPLLADEPALCPLGESALEPPPGLLATLDRTLDGPGAVARDASTELAELNRVRAQLRTRAESLAEQRCARPDLSDCMGRGRSLRWQSGRAVLEVPDAVASTIRGVRRGVGAGGRSTLFEPMELVGTNNDLEIVETRMQREERRVLHDLTTVLRQHLGALHGLIEALTWTDLAFAAGRLSSRFNCSAPELVLDPGVILDQAYNPLLLLQAENGQLPKPPVPLTLSLGPNLPLILITGPNTGGKTVALKTVGLLVAMAQCGLHIPSEGACVIGWYRRVMVDVGDRQSLYHRLSTFAGHVEVLKRILVEADRHTLVLLDELGTGTDPEEGAALAMAVLDELLDRGTHAIVTTHLSPLKTYALDRERVTSAAMAFDHDSMSPTYRLRVGDTGASLGLAIAGRNGLPDTVLDRARAHLSRLHRH